MTKALMSLKEAVGEYQKQSGNAFIRDATIHRFEYSYELAHKMLKRYLETTESSSEEIDQMSFATLIRTGAEKGLLKNSWDTWSVYRHARNLTSHTYDEKKAIEVCEIVPDFSNVLPFNHCDFHPESYSIPACSMRIGFL